MHGTVDDHAAEPFVALTGWRHKGHEGGQIQAVSELVPDLRPAVTTSPMRAVGRLLGVGLVAMFAGQVVVVGVCAASAVGVWSGYRDGADPGKMRFLTGFALTSAIALWARSWG